MWIEITKDTIIPNREVLGYNEKWKNLDFNPDGIRLCYYLTTEEEWVSAGWDGCNDTYTGKFSNDCPEEDDYAPPTHYMLKPKFEIS